MERARYESALIKLDLCLALKAISGLVFLKAILMRIKYIKQILILDIAEGIEVYIPKALSQSQLPSSFRFYDPILMMINMKTPDERV